MRAFARRLCHSEAAATVIEYALIAGLISIVLLAGMSVLGDNLTNVFDEIGNHL